MRWGATILVGLACLAAPATADGPSAVPADFKLLVAAFRLGRDPVSTEELVAIDGRVYQFASDSREVVVIEPARGRVELLDLDRRIQAEVGFDRLDDALIRIRSTLAEAIGLREASGKRADAIEAKMTRDMVDPRFALAFDPAARRVRLTNPTIEVEALGEPEPDAARLALIRAALEAVAKLGAFRSPTDLPPFAELDALAALTGDRKLRPVELAYLYRLAGPPRKFRRTYRLLPALPDRDREAIRRVDRLREAVPHVRYEQYRKNR